LGRSATGLGKGNLSYGMDMNVETTKAIRLSKHSSAVQIMREQ